MWDFRWNSGGISGFLGGAEHLEVFFLGLRCFWILEGFGFWRSLSEVLCLFGEEGPTSSKSLAYLVVALASSSAENL